MLGHKYLPKIWISSILQCASLGYGENAGRSEHSVWQGTWGSFGKWCCLCSNRIRWQAKKGSRREERKNQDLLHPSLAGKPQLSFGTGLSCKKYRMNSPYTPWLFFLRLETAKRSMQGYGEKRKTNLKWRWWIWCAGGTWADRIHKVSMAVFY